MECTQSSTQSSTQSESLAHTFDDDHSKQHGAIVRKYERSIICIKADQ